eukprot:m51a1_g4341 hypothetical protein (102) ;mRNA; f:190469-190950
MDVDDFVVRGAARTRRSAVLGAVRGADSPASAVARLSSFDYFRAVAAARSPPLLPEWAAALLPPFLRPRAPPLVIDVVEPARDIRADALRCVTAISIVILH